jgi:hypothetical protein
MSTVKDTVKDTLIGFSLGIAVSLFAAWLWWGSNAIHIMVIQDLKQNRDIECMKVIHE